MIKYRNRHIQRLASQERRVDQLAAQPPRRPKPPSW